MNSYTPTPGRGTWPSARIVAIAVLLGVAGCDDEPPTSPEPRPIGVVGRWSGSMIDRDAGTGRLEVEMIGTEEVPTGTFSLTLADGARVGGLVIGRTNERPTIVLTFLISESSRDCPGAPGFAYRARLVLTDNRLTGTYSPELGCPVLSSGSMELSR